MTETGELERLLQFFYQCPVGLLECDDHGTIATVNPAAARMLAPVLEGRDPTQLLPVLRHLDPELADLLVADPTRMGPLTVGRRVLMPPASGSQWVEIMLVRVDIDRVAGVLVDISEERRIAEREHAIVAELAAVNSDLDRANLMQSDMLAMLGHDVRQPLSVVLALAEDLTDEWGDYTDDYKIEQVRRMAAAARSMNELVDDVMAMVSLDSGTIRCRPTPTPVAEAVASALSATAGTGDVRTAVAGTPVAFADPWQLRQIVSNLVSNALKYGAAPVTIEVTSRTGRVELAVKDCGPGVPDRFVPQLFDRFVRGDDPEGNRGSGFGLYIVRRLVEANGGTITYRPNEPAGACFTVRLPLVSADGGPDGA